MKFIYSVLFFVFLVVSACVPMKTSFYPLEKATQPSLYNKGIKKVAILVNSRDKYERRQIESGALKALIARGYEVSSRSDLKSLKREIDFQHSGLTDSDAVKLGKIIGVPAVLVFQKYKREKLGYSLGARLIDIETSQVLFLSKGFDTRLEKLAFSLSYELPLASKDAVLIKEESTTREKAVAKNDYDDIDVIAVNAFKAKHYKKIAVLAENVFNARREIEDRFMMALMNKGITVPSRSDLRAVMKEVGFQQSGMTDGSSVRLGKILNAQAIMLIQTKKYYRTRGRYASIDFALMVKVIDIQTGEVMLIAGEDPISGYSAKWVKNYYFDKILDKTSMDVSGAF